MNKFISTLFCCLVVLPLCLRAQGTAFSNCSFESKILGRVMHFSIYLPESYAVSDIEYPVLYLLHGGGDNYKDWLLKGQAAQIADETLGKDGVPEMIIVMPDGVKNWYCNNYTGDFRYEDFFYEELIPYVEQNYRCRTEREYRAISGLSMGGFGCLLYALKHPGKYIACYGMSIGMFSDERALSGGGRPMDGKKWYAEEYFGPLKADGSLPDLWMENNVYRLIKDMPDRQKKKVHFAIEVGDDELNRDQAEVWMLMKENNIPVEVRINDGAHNWIFWRQCLPHALKFVGECFTQQRMFSFTPEEFMEMMKESRKAEKK